MFFMDSFFTPLVAFQSRLLAEPNIRQNKVSASPSVGVLLLLEPQLRLRPL